MRTQSLETGVMTDCRMLAGLFRDRAEQFHSLAGRIREPFAREVLERTATDMRDMADRFRDVRIEPSPFLKLRPVSAVKEPLREGQIRLKFFAG